MLDTRVLGWSQNPTAANTQQCTQGHAQTMNAHPLLHHRSLRICLAAHPTKAAAYQSYILADDTMPLSRWNPEKFYSHDGRLLAYLAMSEGSGRQL
jgi:hypothetical protein